jgi:hypothetical protein
MPASYCAMPEIPARHADPRTTEYDDRAGGNLGGAWSAASSDLLTQSYNFVW